MSLKFYKYHGAGNDFIIIDGRGHKYNPTPETVAFLCRRHKGVGADGLMILEKDPDKDFRMRYFNADGHESTMCGNGGRSIGLFAHHLGIGGLHKTFNGSDGVHSVDVIFTDELGGILSLGMVDVPEVHLGEGYYFLNTGSPHYVEFVDDVQDIDVARRGAVIRHDDKFAPIGGTNVNFVQIIEDGHIRLRTFERGVESETLACGTGSVASVLAAMAATGSDTKRWKADVEGGTLYVEAKRTQTGGFKSITLTGPAKKVFEGEISLIFNE